MKSYKRFIGFLKTAAVCGVITCMIFMPGCGQPGRDQADVRESLGPVPQDSTAGSAGIGAGTGNGSAGNDKAQNTDGTQADNTYSSQENTSPPENRTMEVCGIYIYNEQSACREFIPEVFESRWEKGKDIICFEVINTHEDTISGRVFKYMWEPVWFATEEAGRYRIGYCVDFTINDADSGQKKKVHKMILEPEDTLEYKEFMEFYLYDDYHQTPGVWYSHVEQSQFDEDTLLTSIKFTAGKNAEAVDGDILLTAFIYDPKAGQFDGRGDYTGSAKHTVTVRNAD